MNLSVRFEGGAELAKTLNALPTAVSRKIQNDALEAAAEPIVAVARRMAPREPGGRDLADNIEQQTKRAGVDEFGDAKAAMVVVGPLKGFFYGHFQEWGTVRHAAQPFMRPAFEQNKERSLTIIKDRLWTNIQSFVHSRVVR
jgi:HK97 gp10 family phage protein